MTVAEMLDRMSATEFFEWQAFERLEGPLGDRRGDLRAAAVSFYALVAQGADPYELSLADLVLKFGGDQDDDDDDGWG